MEQKRLALHEILCEILGSRNCYYSPPTGTQVKYPCFVYKLADIDQIYADNKPYIQQLAFQVTIIDEDPDTSLVDKILKLPKCSMSTPPFSRDGLNHFNFLLYF